MQISVSRLGVDIHTNGLKSRLSSAGCLIKCHALRSWPVFIAFIYLLPENWSRARASKTHPQPIPLWNAYVSEEHRTKPLNARLLNIQRGVTPLSYYIAQMFYGRAFGRANTPARAKRAALIDKIKSSLV